MKASYLDSLRKQHKLGRIGGEEGWKGGGECFKFSYCAVWKSLHGGGERQLDRCMTDLYNDLIICSPGTRFSKENPSSSHTDSTLISTLSLTVSLPTITYF